MKHLLKTIIILIVVAIWQTACTQEKEAVYLIFEENKVDTCNKSYYRDGRDKKEYGFIHKKDLMYKTNVVFNLCNQYFVFDPKKHNKEAIKKESVKSVVSIDYLMRRLEEEYLSSNKEILFKNIYIIEKLKDDEYVKYEVTWTDMHFNKN